MMILLQVFLLSNVFCLLPSINGYVHYGVESDRDDTTSEREPVRIFHSHEKRRGHSGSSSESSSGSSSSSDTSSKSSSTSDSYSSSESSSSYSSGSDSSTSSHEDSDELVDDSSLALRFTAFGDPVQVNLVRVNNQLAGTKTPVWLAKGSDSGNVTFQRANVDALGKAYRLYQDRETGSSVLVLRDHHGDTRFVGVVAGYNIYHQPNHGSKRSLSRRSPSDGYTASDDHYVTRGSRRRRDGHNGHGLHSLIEERSKRAVTAPNTTIYPEILVATDFNLGFTSTTSNEFYDHLLYILAFFNGVDLLFQDVSSPDVRLHIAGIVVNSDRAAVPYIYENIGRDGSVRGMKAAEDAGPFYSANLDSSEFPAGSYDIVITLTDTYVCDEVEEDICTSLITGVSTIHPVCENNYPVVNMSALIVDDLAFSGTRIAGHELGHILGAGHDGDEDEGGGDCDFHDGYIMARYNENSTVSLKWSSCSKKTLSEELSTATADCLRNPPDLKKQGTSLPEILPGHIKGTNAQCRSLGYVKSCLGPNVCNSLQCTNDPFLYSRNCKTAGLPASQGSYCGFNRHCINGDCVSVETVN